MPPSKPLRRMNLYPLVTSTSPKNQLYVDHPTIQERGAGWSTIRYFNQETGLEGGSYVQQQQVAICEELGSEKNMIAYIEDYGNTSLVDAGDEL